MKQLCADATLYSREECVYDLHNEQISCRGEKVLCGTLYVSKELHFGAKPISVRISDCVKDLQCVRVWGILVLLATSPLLNGLLVCWQGYLHLYCEKNTPRFTCKQIWRVTSMWTKVSKSFHNYPSIKTLGWAEGSWCRFGFTYFP